MPTYSVTRIVTIIKSLTAREIFWTQPQVKKQLWGGEFWSDGYYAMTVGRLGNERAVGEYVKKQGRQYKQLHRIEQPRLFGL